MAKANVGDKIEIVRPFMTRGNYRMGDILTVTDIEHTGVRVEEVTGWIHSREFEVVETPSPTLKSATIDQLMAELKRRVESVSQVIGVSEMTEAIEELAPKAPMPARETIVRLAINDVNQIEARGRNERVSGGDEGNDTYRDKFYNVQFVVNKDKRTVVALVRYGFHMNVAKPVIHRGVAKCDPSDCFNEHIGKAIAVRRAFGLDVPSEYLNAPKPDGKQAGDIVEYGEKVRRLIEPDGTEEFIYGETAHVRSDTGQNGRVIDDTARY